MFCAARLERLEVLCRRRDPDGLRHWCSGAAAVSGASLVPGGGVGDCREPASRWRRWRAGASPRAGPTQDFSISPSTFCFMPRTVWVYYRRSGAKRAYWGLAAFFFFYRTGSSFLAFAALAVKTSDSQPGRMRIEPFYYRGLTESETILLFVLCCLFPAYFPGWRRMAVQRVCWLTTPLTRIYSGYSDAEAASSAPGITRLLAAVIRRVPGLHRVFGSLLHSRTSRHRTPDIFSAHGAGVHKGLSAPAGAAVKTCWSGRIFHCRHMAVISARGAVRVVGVFHGCGVAPGVTGGRRQSRLWRYSCSRWWLPINSGQERILTSDAS